MKEYAKEYIFNVKPNILPDCIYGAMTSANNFCHCQTLVTGRACNVIDAMQTSVAFILLVMDNTDLASNSVGYWPDMRNSTKIVYTSLGKR